MAVDANFVRAESYFPTEGRLNDEFNGNFKLVIEVTSDEPVTIPAGAFGIGVLWKAKPYLLAVNDEPFETPAKIELTWVEPPTIADFLTAFGEELPEETKTYSYSWITGFFVNEQWIIDPNGQQFAVTDKWDTELLVIVEPFPWEKVLMGAGIGAVVLGAMAVLAVRRPEYVRRVPEYARRGVEYVRERIPARA
jgi:hypothetical protein